MKYFQIILVGLFLSVFSLKMNEQQVISIDDTKTPEELINDVFSKKFLRFCIKY
jgi:hypothetical protein